MCNDHKRVVIITGSARGIGFAIAASFAKNGDQPIIVDLTEEAVAKATTNLADNYDCEQVGYVTDITDSAAVKELVERVIARFGRIDIVVNNAGLQFISPIEDFPEEKWDLLINVMLKGPFLLTKYVVPHMKQRDFGRIINISSVHGRTASPFKAAYISAKHGVVGLTRTVALEVANNNITVNAVMPGAVQTELVENQLEKLANEDGITREEALHKHLLNKQALKRYIKPEEVAATTLFLASDEAASITGETISVSGGW
ncbi:3-hydroxybutyrate dehydrogenase [Lottiidibacillus patelloidae]|uniref:3-hydroxybutyrate dehydrogenase n=1 Tax=Lottiidibacillus patelloidae TaxID=2670334 RepID=A0A263BUD6_9BACI|nr:3-hydroxybutyrate dehydrogenase [Lottiidibacillus patelloidae]OZM56937.1 3-hydroxybutyrate dehydrogenase [Lottiidibacillus patelloidae]